MTVKKICLWSVHLICYIWFIVSIDKNITVVPYNLMLGVNLENTQMRSLSHDKIMSMWAERKKYIVGLDYYREEQVQKLQFVLSCNSDWPQNRIRK